MTAAPIPTPDSAEELVFRCLESDDPDRAIDELCADRPGLRGRARALVGHLRRFGLLGDHGAVVAAVPEALGPYRLRARLGEGGMGIVYEAWDAVRSRAVAVKLVRPDMVPFRNSRQRFENEIAAITRLDHPGIARLYQAGEEHGIRYFAMELVEGESLAELVARLSGRDPAQLTGRDLVVGSLAPVDATTSERSMLLAASWTEACLRVVRDVALALAHAHDQGILHRDVKPANILLGADGRPRLLDFGLARADDAETMTRSGAVLGSLQYMSPEQLAGDRDAVDASSDTYSLGVVLHELLTLRSPFAGDDPELIRRRILTGRSPRLRRLNPAVPRGVAAVCRDAMARDRRSRFASAGQLAGELDVLLRGKTTSQGIRPGAWRRHRRVMILAWGAALLGVAILSVWAAGLRSENRELQRTTERLSIAASAAAKNEAKARWSAYRGLVQAAQAALSRNDRPAALRLLDQAPRELRAWEWSYLHRAAAPPPAPAFALTDKVDALFRVNPTGKDDTLIVSLGASTLAECRRSDGALGRRWTFPDRLASRSSSPGDATLYAHVTRADPRRIQFFELEKTQPRSFDAGEPVRSVAIAPGGKAAAALLAGGGLLLIDVPALRVSHRVGGAAGERWSLGRFSRDGARFLTGARAALAVFDVGTGAPVARLEPETSGDIVSAWFDGHRHVLVLDQYQLLRVRVHDGAIRGRLPGSVSHVCPDPDGASVWVLDADGTLGCWRWDRPVLLAELRGNPGRNRLALDAARDHLLAWSVEGDKALWDLDLTALHSRWIAHPHIGLGEVEVSSGGSVVLSRSDSHTLLRRPGQRARRLAGLEGVVRVAFLGEDRLAAAMHRGRDLVIYDLARQVEVKRLAGHTSSVRSVATLSDGRVASSDDDGHVRIWDVEAGRTDMEFLAHRGRIVCILALPGGRLLTGGRDGAVVLWTLPAGAQQPVRRQLMTLGDLVYGLTTTPDHRVVIAGSRTGEVQVLDLDADRVVRRARLRSVSALAVSPDGRRLVSSSYSETTVRIHDLATFDEVLVLPADLDNVSDVKFMPDGALVSLDWSALARFWPIR